MEKKLPKNWVETDLGNFFNLQYGKGLSTSELTEEGFDVYGANGIIGKYTSYSFENSKVIISCRGAASGAIHKTKPKSFVTSNSIILDEKSKELINLDFVKYTMISLDKSTVITGTAQPQITIQLLKYLQFPLPPLVEQNLIVAKLDNLFSQLEIIKTSMATIPVLLKNFRQQVLTQAVTRKLTEEWRKEKELEELSLIELSHFCKDSFYGHTSEGFPTVRTTDMSDDGKIILSNNIPRVKIEDPKKIELYKVKKGDLLITRTGSIGKMARYFEKEIVIPSAYLIRFRFNQLAITDYIYYCLISPYGQTQMGLNSIAVTQANLNAQKIKIIKIPNITIEEQQEIVNRIENLFEKADAIEKKYKTLKEKIDNLPQAILHKAFKGELAAQLDTDGDARELLQQIQDLKAQTAKQSKKKVTAKVKKYEEVKESLGMVAEPKTVSGL
jgi:type I restriction enzyme S subunit